MIPITLNRSNILQWIYFGLLEAWRVLVAVVTGRGFRVNDVAKQLQFIGGGRVGYLDMLRHQKLKISLGNHVIHTYPLMH